MTPVLCLMDKDDELEYTLLNKRDVMVYQIPPASSSSGHKADDWKKCIWRGRCRIAGKGQDLAIKMLDPSSGELFAQCVIPKGEHEKYVERVIDSSRYFVLKITNGERHAFIGLGFEDRNDAFDFNVTLSDFKSTWVDRDKEVEEPATLAPAKDLSLREGQKITINLKGVGTGTRRSVERTETTNDGSTGFAGLLAPPPTAGGHSRRQQSSVQPPPLAPPASSMAPAVRGAVASSVSPAPTEDFFGDFDEFQSAPTAGAAPAPALAAGPAAGLAAQLGQLHLGGGAAASAEGAAALTRTPGPSLAAQPIPFTAAAPPVQSPQQSVDLFGGFQGLGAVAPPATAPTAAAPRPRQGGDPFDEFDIFK